MKVEQALDIVREAFFAIIQVAGPTLAIALIIGLVISILQATTQLQEQTLSFVPKILAVIASLIIFGNFMLNVMIEFTEKIFETIASL
ncbi:flagellar biosynthesis protein FliQ [Desemzia sp. C1]|uniref:Flagellar biosynthetic protein FliQ n=1 Tax=Desemzia incerta TaxID=82801 RepID=A0A1I5UNJ2_9LACT|nr:MULTISPECIES: flagellar biosynthesis protein FliQ [Desemzia]MCI3028083.1 flagellar biosynthesis protein FliQ [Desemzia sp. C1]SFP96873.1 flagellar biosynthetic protein FliQ [Desemzia incerta]